VRAYAIVDAEDYAAVARYSWSLESTGYAKRNRSRSEPRPRKAYLHREIAGCVPGDGLEVDHLNFDRLDCRRGNLVVGTPEANRRRQRGWGGRQRGVYFAKDRGKWVAQANIGRRGESRHRTLGYFETEHEATMAVEAFWRTADAA
jgi:hypothetical protein